MGTGDAAGRVIAGRYRLLRSLGAGGMGRVWLAHDQELACDVALKEITVHRDLPERELHARIARARSEARHSARLRGHPHVVTVYDSVIDHGLPWLVMEYVPGARDLEAVVRDDGPLSPADTARIGLALLDALTTGHQLGILHRDVKPSNVLLTSTTPQEPHGTGIGRVLLSDYGISLQQDADEPRLTTTSGIIGTPGYLAPERARGAEPTPASDLFSLGATLYYAVEGHAPFDRGSYAATLTALLTEEPTPPRRAGNLTSVLLNLLVKDPTQRLNTDTATHLLTQFTVESTRTRQVTVTQPIKPPSPPRPATPREIPKRAEPKQPRSLGTPKRTWSIWGRPTELPRRPQPKRTPKPQPSKNPRPWRQPRPPTRTRNQQATRKKRRIIATTTAALVAGLLTWLVLKGSHGTQPPSQRASKAPSATAPTKPYGDVVGITQELQVGDCVTARWTGPRFAYLPALKLVNCTSETPDGQVMKTVTPNSASDQGCNSALKDTVTAMADAEAYPLVPAVGSDVQKTACLIFNKDSNNYGPVGPFRKIGDSTGVQNAQIGDCYNTKETAGGLTQYLAKCDAPHNAQVVGFAKMTSQNNDECLPEYGSLYNSSTYSIYSVTPSGDLWKQGFHYAECNIVRLGKQRLDSPITPSTP
ncbi:serine/threonine-protein kinase [Streptomyces sp. NPDC001709]